MLITNKSYGDFTKITIGPIYARKDSMRRYKGVELLIMENSDDGYICLKVKDKKFLELEKLANKILKELEDG